MKRYEFVTENPVARFRYQGSHTHPVRRVVIVTRETPTLITGYELREGKILRGFSQAPIRSYRKDRITRYGQYCRIKKGKLRCTTLVRKPLADLIVAGV